MRIKRKPLNLEHTLPDELLLDARSVSDRTGIPIRALARALPPPDRIINRRRFWRLSTLNAARSR